MCVSRTRPPAGCRRIAATGPTSISSWWSGARPGPPPGRGAAQARRHRRGSADPRVTGNGPRLTAAELCDRAGRYRGARTAGLRAARRRKNPGGGRLDRRTRVSQVIAPAEEYDLTVAAAGGELPEQRVQGPVAARGSPGRPPAPPRGAQPLRRADGAGAATGEPDLRGHDVRAVGLHPGHVPAARGSGRREPGCHARNAAHAAAHD